MSEWMNDTRLSFAIDDDFVKQVTNLFPCPSVYWRINAVELTEAFTDLIVFPNRRSLTFRAGHECSVSLLDPGCVQQQSVQPRRDSEGKHSRQHLNVCPAVAVTCHPPPKLFSVSPLDGPQNGKLPTLVSEADKHWLSNCAKIARLVNASSLVVTLMLLWV